jgi:hypothetical protein
MQQNPNKGDVARVALEMIDKRSRLENRLLFAQLERLYPDLGGREYGDVIGQLKELNLIRTIDAGYDRIHEITRDGVCALHDDDES